MGIVKRDSNPSSTEGLILRQWPSQCGPQTFCITWELVRNANPKIPPQPISAESETGGGSQQSVPLTSSPGDFIAQV